MTNIALVVLDTLRKDRFDDQFEWLPGTTYDNAWSTSHWTVPAHASLFTGLYPSESGVHSRSVSLDCDEPVLAELLRANGYTTHCLSANVNVTDEFGFTRGFDTFTGNWRVNSMSENLFDWGAFVAEHRDDGLGRFPRAMIECVRSESATIPSVRRGLQMKLHDLGVGAAKDSGAAKFYEVIRDREFSDDEFLFVNLMEAHSPYNVPRRYRTVEEPAVDGLRATVDPDMNPNDELVREAYDTAVAYLSTMYERMFAELRTEFDVIITLGDHGELLGEHGSYQHMYGLYPELVHVPLSVYTGESTAETRTENVSLLDVHRTVLEFAGVDAPSRGRDLTGELPDRELLTEFHGVAPLQYEQLVEAGYAGVDHLRDATLHGVAKGETYAYETFDGLSVHGPPPDGWEPTETIERLCEELTVRETDDQVDVDAQTLRHLKDLGYA